MEKLATLKGRDAAGQAPPEARLSTWGKLAAVTLMAVYLSVFMEWLFYVTKPSFMDSIPFRTKISILLLSGLVLLVLCLVIQLLLFALSHLPAISRSWKVFLSIGAILPTLFLAGTALLMVDNFTYTVFHFGIINTKGIQRGLYGLFFVLLVAAFYLWLVRTLLRQSRRGRVNATLKTQFYASFAILLVSVALGGNYFLSGRSSAIIPDTGSAVKRPNILLIGSDALNADRLSLYGYQRQTTPFLEQFAQSSLVSENNFSNSSISAGSFASIFTGKLPLETRVLFPPDILKGDDAVQHFPGILENEGYYTAEFSVDYYADASQYNLQDGFFAINNRPVTIPAIYSVAHRYAPEEVAYFLSTFAKRLDDRIEHIFYLRTMTNPLLEVNTGVDKTMTDQQRIDNTLSIFQNAQQPVFVHVYMLGTHMGVIKPKSQVFSQGETMNNSNTNDFYDDAVLDFDTHMKEVVNSLQQMGKLDQTIIIVYTDHGIGDTSNVRLPLLFHFPNGEYTGKINHNTQNIDIAPTILDYMGIAKPSWMSGQSLLQGEPPANRPIFSAVPNFTFLNDLNQLQLDPSKTKPPFYQFGTIGMVICQRAYAVNTASLTWQAGDIPGYPNPCDPASLPDNKQAQRIMLDELQRDGFDIARLSEALENETQ